MKYILSNKNEYKILIDFAKSNRKNPTYAERVVWNELRRNNLGFKFRRQAVIGKYIVDFVCIEAKIIVEIDGDSHEDRGEYDKYRDEYMQGAGYTVLRFTNNEALNNWQNCALKIKETYQKIVFGGRC
jgi:very-short-patch-repair endonuclease